MTDTGGVLSAIDACLEGMLYDDAMRRAPDEPDPTPKLDGATVSLTFVDEVTNWPNPEPALAAFSQFAAELQRAARSISEGVSQVLAPSFDALQVAFHKRAHGEDGKHRRRFSTCNPAGFPKSMSINRNEYHRGRR
ncbi:hypothetical protein ACWEJ6_20725 [Nonomuraea sp. NPDC004702]